MAEQTFITLEDIQGSPKLTQLGVKPGDSYTVGQDGNPILKRIHSIEEDAKTPYYRLTEEDIAGSPNLTEIGASPGDVIQDNEVVKTGSDSWWNNFAYYADQADGITDNVWAWLESNAPEELLGPIFGQTSFSIEDGFDYRSGDELYGEGFSDASPEERRGYIARWKDREISEAYGPYFESESDSASAVAGGLTGAILDPSTLIAPHATVAKTALTGAGLGLAYSLSEDIAKEGEISIDLEKAAMSTVLGGAGGAGLSLVGKGAKAGFRSNAVKQAEKRLVRIEKAIKDETDLGFPVGTAIDNVATPRIIASLDKDIKLAGRKLRLPSRAKSKVEQNFSDKIASDSFITRLLSKPIDRVLGNISTRIGNVSMPVRNHMRKFERRGLVNTARDLSKVKDWQKGVSKLSKNSQAAIGRHLNNGNFGAAKSLMGKDLLNNFKDVESVLTRLGQELPEAGHPFTPVKNYFPRLLKDHDKFLRSIGKERAGEVRQALNKYAAGTKNNKGQTIRREMEVEEIPDFIRAEIINRAVRGTGKREGSKPSFQKKRVFDEIPESALPFYASPQSALSNYIRKANSTVEKGKFFGKHLDKDDIEESIGGYVRAAQKREGLTDEQVDELVSLLKSRFQGDLRAPNKVLGVIKDLGYLGTIANPISAITQFGDIANTAAKFGLRDSLAAMFSTKLVKLIDLGIDNASVEFADLSKVSKALEAAFKYSGFKAVDKLGKETLINASLRNSFRKVNTKKGEAAFRRKWGKSYGDEIEALVADLKSGRVTDLVKYHSFNELSDVQPVSLLETPQFYLDHPNGRIFYALKTFTLKQYDIVRRDIVQEFRQGSKKQAIKRAVVLGTYLAGANVGTKTVKDILSGRDPDIENLPDNTLWALLGVFGLNRYVSERYLKQGKLVEAGFSIVMPATPIIESIVQAPYEANKEDPNMAKLLKSVPVVGDLFYNWFGGGAEAYNEKLGKNR